MEESPNLLMSDGFDVHKGFANISYENHRLILKTSAGAALERHEDKILVVVESEESYSWIVINDKYRLKCYQYLDKENFPKDFIANNKAKQNDSVLYECLKESFLDACIIIEKMNILMESLSTQLDKKTFLKLSASKFGAIFRKENNQGLKELAEAAVKKKTSKLQKSEEGVLTGSGNPKARTYETKALEWLNKKLSKGQKMEKGKYGSNKAFPWIGCEPDGITKDGKSMLEVKSHEKKSLEEVYYLNKEVDPKRKLRKGSYEYCQILGNANIFGVKNVKLVVYLASKTDSKEEFNEFDIEFESDEWEKLFYVLKCYYFSNYLPRSLERLPDKLFLKLLSKETQDLWTGD